MKRNKTIFTAHGTNGKTNGSRKTNNQRDGPFVTKRVADRTIQKNASFLPPLTPYLPDEVKSYIDRMKKTEKLDRLVERSNDILFKCHTVFPFDFFPDTLIIDKTKINIVRRLFFYSESVHGIMIKTIKDLQVDTNLFFATLTIIPDVYIGQTTEVAYMKKSDALEARRIIQGLMLCQREQIDLSDLKTDDIKHKIESAGTAVESRYAE